MRSKPNARPEPFLTLSARELAARATRGDTEATGLLLRSIRPMVRGVVRRVLGPGCDRVDDAVQQTLIAFVHALPAYRGEAEPSSFAKTIALRTALAARRGYVSDRARSDGGDAGVLPSESPLPTMHVIAQRRRALLRQLLEEIPEEQAEALALRVVFGQSLHEIASATRAPLNTVRSRIRLAKEALRRKIEAEPSMMDTLDLAE